MITYQAIHHISLNVTNLERSTHFYCELLGFIVIDRPPIQSQGIWLGIGHSGQQIHLIVHEQATLRSRSIDPLDNHFAILVNDYKQTIEWLQSSNIPYIARPNSPAGYNQIFIEDPDHNMIEFDIARE
jgi:glyoxylase I family protein